MIETRKQNMDINTKTTSTATTAVTKPHGRRIEVRQHPFDSEIASHLVKALDDELAHMYPDWESLPHPGFRHGKVGGDQLANVSEAGPVNPKPKLNVTRRRSDDGEERKAALSTRDDNDGVPVLDAMDADDVDRTGANSDTAAAALTPSQISKMYFWVAFEVDDDDEEVEEKDQQAAAAAAAATRDDTISSSNINDDPPPPSSLSPSLSSNTKHQGKPVGCIGLRLMPYFPHHRAQNTSSSPQSTSQFHPNHTGTNHAEIKRLYIHPTHRGRRSFPPPYSSSSPSPNSNAKSISELLLTTAAEHAKRVLYVDKLVLETGVRQHSAIRLYERLGWVRRRDGEFGDYVGAGVADGGVSMCFEMVL